MPFFRTSGNRRAQYALKNHPAWGLKLPGLLSRIGRGIQPGRTMTRASNMINSVTQITPEILDEIITQLRTGKVTIDICGNDDYGKSLALDDDGNVFVAGYARIGSYYDFAVIKLDPTGVFATDFGGNGKVTIDISGSWDYGHSLALDDTGNVFVAGYAYTGTNNDFAVIKLDPTGEFATDFGGNGKVTIDICGNAKSDYGYSLALDDDGNVFVAGYVGTGSDDDFVVIKLDPTGVLATDFGELV